MVIKMNTQERKEGRARADNVHRKVGHAIRVMESSFKRRFMQDGIEAGLDEVTIVHGWILGYLHCNERTEKKEIYQKTIESEFSMGRSTVTTVVQLLEKKGYIMREAVPWDARLKKIVLTDLGRETAIKSKRTLDKIEECMLWNISPEELECFYGVADKIAENLNPKD